MQDDLDNDTTRPDEQPEPDAAGGVFRRLRFGAGSRATIMLGLTVGIVTVTAVIPYEPSWPVSRV